MAVDLTDSDKRKEYLTEKLDDLLDGINESYGVTLMEELISRLELDKDDDFIFFEKLFFNIHRGTSWEPLLSVLALK